MAWARTNDQYANNVTTNPVNVTAFANALTPGSLIVVGVRITDTSGPSTPTDTAGNTYLDCGIGPIPYGANTAYCQLFYALNTHNTASNVISCVNAGGKSYYIACAEFTGNDNGLYGLSVIDGTPSGNANANSGTGGGQNVVTGNTTPLNNGDLILGFGKSAGGFTQGTGFTGFGQSYMEYLVQTTAVAIQATWHTTNSQTYSAIVCAFRALNLSVNLNQFVS